MKERKRQNKGNKQETEDRNGRVERKNGVKRQPRNIAVKNSKQGQGEQKCKETGKRNRKKIERGTKEREIKEEMKLRKKNRHKQTNKETQKVKGYSKPASCWSQLWCLK
jgi:hypothetical protein